MSEGWSGASDPQGIEEGTATTAGRGPQDESPVGEAGAPELLRRISTLTAALDDAIVTLSAVRCASLSPDWEDSGPHFHGVIGETLQRIATLTKGEGGKPSNTQEIEP